MPTNTDPPPEDDPPAPDPSRRRALSRLTIAAGTCLGCAVAAGPIGVALSPLVRGDDGADDGAAWARVGALARFSVGGPPTRVVLRADRRDAWLVRRDVSLGSVLVERLADDEFRVFSAVCPHLGCAVGFRASTDAYFCPCHGSAFTRDGALVPEKPDGSQNPSPRPLDPLPWRVAGGALEVQWIRFEVGAAERRRIA